MGSIGNALTKEQPNQAVQTWKNFVVQKSIKLEGFDLIEMNLVQAVL